MHPLFCSIQDAPYIQFYNIESAPLICQNIQGASSIEHTIYGHVLGHKGGGGARAPSAPWLDPPLRSIKALSYFFLKIIYRETPEYILSEKKCYKRVTEIPKV